MAVTKITFENKTGIQNDASVARKNKVVDEDMNEIKQVVNNNADEVSEIQENIEDLQGGQGTADADITSLKNRVNTLETDNTQNKSDINILKNDNETNKSNISTLQENVSDLETNKVSKVDGMGLSEENFSTGLKNKLAGLKNYDDTELQEKVSALESDNETNKSNIEELQEDNIQNKTDITDIKEEQETQNLYIENLQTNDSKQDELISKLKSAALNAETEEAKSLHVTDANKFGQLEVLGNHEQETREGKNRFKLPDSGNNNGITYTNNGDGTFNISGTATKQASFSIVVPLENSGFEQGKNYTISSNIEIGNIKYYVHSCTASGAWNKTLLDFINETSKTKEMPAPSTDYISLNIVVFKDVTVNYQNVTVQIEEGTEEKEYEQYGASPSPGYPSLVKCLGSNKNEFNIENTRVLNNTVLDSVDENSITFTNSGLGVNRQVFIECYLEKGTYAIQRKFEILEGVGTESSGAVALYQANTWKQSLLTATDKTKTFTITESNTYRIRLSINDSHNMSENVKIKFYDIKIEKGTEATSYSPPGQGSTKISKINKNLFDKNNYKFLNAVISPKNLNIGSENNKRITVYIPCEQKTTYTIQKKSSNLFNLGTTEKEPTFNMAMLQGSNNITNSIAKITTLENANYLLVSFETDNNNVSKEEILDSLQIEIGDTATNKVEHEQTNYILYIQQEMLKGDYFIKEADGWKEVHGFGKYVFDGTENYIKSPLSDDDYLKTYTNTPIISAEEIKFDGKMFATRYKNIGIYSSSTTDNRIACRSQLHTQISTEFLTENTAEAYKALLAEWKNEGNPLVVFYELINPTKLACTETQSAVLEELNNLSLFNGVNNIITAEDIALLKLKYALNAKIYIDNLLAKQSENTVAEEV